MYKLPNLLSLEPRIQFFSIPEKRGIGLIDADPPAIPAKLPEKQLCKSPHRVVEDLHPRATEIEAISKGLGRGA